MPPLRTSSPRAGSSAGRSDIRSRRGSHGDCGTRAHALWLKPLPYLEPDRFVYIGTRHDPSGTPAPLTAAELAAFGRGTGTLSGFAGFTCGAGIARFGGEPVRIVAYNVSPNLFSVLGVAPAMGRDFRAEDASPGTNVVMLSHLMWTQRFARDPAIVGKTMTLHGSPYEVVGVMPASFTFPRGLQAAVWIPATFPESTFGSARQLQSVARLAEGRTIDDARREAASRIAAVGSSAPSSTGRWVASVMEAGITASPSTRLSFQVLLGIVGLFLLIACANLAGLLLARSAARRTELAVCLSIGASRWRLARLLLVESAIVSAAGCLLGILLAVYASRLLSAIIPATLPGIADVAVNGPVLAITTGASVLCAVLIGLLPALSLRSMRPVEALSASRTVARSSSRAERALRAMSPDFLLENETSFGEIIANSLALERAQSAFALLTGVLSAVVLPALHAN